MTIDLAAFDLTIIPKTMKTFNEVRLIVRQMDFPIQAWMWQSVVLKSDMLPLEIKYKMDTFSQFPPTITNEYLNYFLIGTLKGIAYAWIISSSFGWI